MCTHRYKTNMLRIKKEIKCKKQYEILAIIFSSTNAIITVSISHWNFSQN